IRMPEVEIREGDIWTLGLGDSQFSYVASASDGLTPEGVARKLAGLVNDQDHPNHDVNWIADDKAFYNLQGLGLRSGGVNGKPFNGSYINGVETIDIRMGVEGDQFNLNVRDIHGTPMNTNLALGAGDDSLFVASVSGETNILGGADSDTITVGNTVQTVDDILSYLYFDGDGSIEEQSSGIVYHPSTHDRILANVPFVYTQTEAGSPGSPSIQNKEAILSSERTVHISVLDTATVGSLSNATLLSDPVAQYWTEAQLELVGSVIEGEKWTLQLNDVVYDYVVQSTDEAISDVVEGLVSAASASHYNVRSSADRNTIQINQTAVADVPFTCSIINGLDRKTQVSGTLFNDFLQFELKGNLVVENTWEIMLDGKSYDHTVTEGDTVQIVANNIFEKISADYDARLNQFLDLYVVEIDPFTGKTIKDTVHYRGVQEMGYLETGYQLYGNAVWGYEVDGAIVVDPTHADSVLLYEDALGNLTTVNSGKQVIVLKDHDEAGAVPLYFAENGTLTTSSSSGAQALQISQASSTLAPLYFDDSDMIPGGDTQQIVTLTSTKQIGKNNLDNLLTHQEPVAVLYDLNGNKALAHPIKDLSGDDQVGFQFKGYQQYGYFINGDGVKTTTNIGADYTIREDFNDAMAVPLYIRTDSFGISQITTENIEDSIFITIHGAASNTAVAVSGQGRSMTDTAGSDGVAQVVIPTNNIQNGVNWTLSVGSRTYTYLTGSNGDDVSSLAVGKGLALAVNAAAQDGVTADSSVAFTRPYILYSNHHGSANVSVTDVNDSQVTIPRGNVSDQPLYLDSSGNLTTEVTSRLTSFRGFQRLAQGDPLFLTNERSVTTDPDSGHQQLIVVSNQLLYLDNNGNPTSRPTNNTQWIMYDEATSLRDFDRSGAQLASVSLYLDPDDRPTNRIKNPSVVVDNANTTGYAVPLYLDELGDKTELPSTNKAYAQTDDNLASLIWYDSEGLSVETADPLTIPRVKDNGLSAGTALYDRPANAKATIEVDRLKLVTATRPFEIYQTIYDFGVDELIVQNAGSNSINDGSLSYDEITDMTRLSGILPENNVLAAISLESIEVRLGAQSDRFIIHSTNVDTTIKTNGGMDVLTIETANGPTVIDTGYGSDVIEVKSIDAPTQVFLGEGVDMVNITDNGKVDGINADLTLHGEGDSDIINVDNSASTSSGTLSLAARGVLTFDRLTGLNMGGQIIYDDAEAFNIDLGSGDDEFILESTHSGATHVSDLSGNDSYFIKTISGSTNIDTDLGSDTFTIGSNSHDLLGIQGVLTLLAGGNHDRLVVDSAGSELDQKGELTDNSLAGFGMSDSFTFHDIEELVATFGEHVDELTISSTISGRTTIDTSGGMDVVKFETYNGHTTLKTGAHSDKITVFDGDGDSAGAGSVLTIDGGSDGDLYQVIAAQSVLGTSFINLNDSGETLEGASGIDTLEYRGSHVNDLIQLDTVYVRAEDLDKEFASDDWVDFGKHNEGLLISHFNPDAAGDYDKLDPENTDAMLQVNEVDLQVGEHMQIVNYSTIETVTVYGGNGDDKFVADDTAQEVNIYGNAGDDQFYVGSVLETELVLVEGKEVAVVVEITNGASFELKIYGGEGDDYFEVNHNVADIELYGDNGSDTFFVKALLTFNQDEDLVELENSVTTVSAVAGEGSEDSQKDGNDTREVDLDALVYVENANVKIDGGAGFDSVAVVGTVLADTFYIFTELNENNQVVQRIYGAGVKLQELLNVERIQVITGAGDDRVFVYGVDLGPVADLLVNTGTGSDSVVLGGPARKIDLNFPKRSRTDYATVDGYQAGGEALVAYGLGIDLTEDLDRVVPFNVEEPAHTRIQEIPAAETLEGIVTPVMFLDPDGVADTIVFNNQNGPSNLIYQELDLQRKSITTEKSLVLYPVSSSVNEAG
ncbi:calcium-binding protein, partial [Verrucomicrobia bacterium]|nr:calcium-binding protein [Verrucomicrobiota bacterium]